MLERASEQLPERVRALEDQLGVVLPLKIIFQPLLAYLAARYIFALDSAEVLAVTLFAGLPTAQNTFIYATEYKVPNGLSRDAVVASSVLSLGTLSLILWLLG